MRDRALTTAAHRPAKMTVETVRKQRVEFPDAMALPVRQVRRRDAKLERLDRKSVRAVIVDRASERRSTADGAPHMLPPARLHRDQCQPDIAFPGAPPCHQIDESTGLANLDPRGVERLEKRPTLVHTPINHRGADLRRPTKGGDRRKPLAGELRKATTAR